MMTIGERIEVKEFIPTKANDIPMAKASMLVAIASVTTTFNLVGSKQRLSSLLKLSFIIRPPKRPITQKRSNGHNPLSGD